MLGWHDTFFPSLYSSSLLSATTMVEYLASLASYDLQFYLHLEVQLYYIRLSDLHWMTPISQTMQVKTGLTLLSSI